MSAIASPAPLASSAKTAVPREPPPEPLAGPRRFLGRQPILDAQSQLFGYELLYRAGETGAFSGDPERATREVIDHWLMLIPAPGPHLAFVNCTRAALLEDYVTLLPPEHTVLEIPRTVDPDPELVLACLALKRKGYRLALDDFAANPAFEPVLEIADFIKIDFLTSDFEARRAIYAMASRSSAQRVAERIEAECQMRIALAEGCTLFQGYFFAHPDLVASRTVPQNSLVYLKLMAALQQAPADLRKIEKIISGDPSLCYRLLRLANSALQGHPGEICSLREALLLVGDDAVRRMVTVAMSGNWTAHHPAVVSLALTRARFCEQLAPSVSGDPAQLYLLGILSLLDVLLETTMDSILKVLPLSPGMKATLLGDDSSASLALDLVRNLESCEWPQCERIQQRLGLPEGSIAALYVESLRWATAAVAS